MLLGHKTTNKQNETKLGSPVALVLSTTTSSTLFPHKALVAYLIINNAIIGILHLIYVHTIEYTVHSKLYQIRCC